MPDLTCLIFVSAEHPMSGGGHQTVEADPDRNVRRSSADPRRLPFHDMRATEGDQEPADRQSLEPRLEPEADNRRRALDRSGDGPGHAAVDQILRTDILSTHNDHRRQEAHGKFKNNNLQLKWKS